MVPGLGEVNQVWVVVLPLQLSEEFIIFGGA